jgi:hypothetical protein
MDKSQPNLVIKLKSKPLDWNPTILAHPRGLVIPFLLFIYTIISLHNTNFLTGLLYKSNLNSGSVLEYALAFTSAALDRHYSKWSATPKTGFIDITTSKDFYRIFSGLQYVSKLHRFYLLCVFSYLLCVPLKTYC